MKLVPILASASKIAEQEYFGGINATPGNILCTRGGAMAREDEKKEMVLVMRKKTY